MRSYIRIFGLLLIFLVCMLFTTPALAAAPQLTVDKDGKASASMSSGTKLFLATYDPETGRFLGLLTGESARVHENTVLRAMQTNDSFAPCGNPNTALVITVPDSTITGGTYDSVIVTAAVQSGDVTLNGVTVRGTVTVYSESSLTLKGCEITDIEANADLAVTVADMAAPSVTTALDTPPSVSVNGEARDVWGVIFEADSTRALTARLVAPENREKDEYGTHIQYTLCFFSPDTADSSFYLDKVVANGVKYTLSPPTGVYSCVQLYVSAEDADFDSLTPVAQWKLPHPIVSSFGSAEFPHAGVTAEAYPDPDNDASCLYSFSGLDLETYSYLLNTPSGTRQLAVASNPVRCETDTDAWAWVGEGMKLSAMTAKLENGVYYITVTKEISIDVSER